MAQCMWKQVNEPKRKNRKYMKSEEDIDEIVRRTTYDNFKGFTYKEIELTKVVGLSG